MRHTSRDRRNRIRHQKARNRLRQQAKQQKKLRREQAKDVVQRAVTRLPYTMKKPSGTTGTLHVGSDSAFDKLVWPSEKSEKENLVLKLALESHQGDLQGRYGGVPNRNPEDHYDFTLANGEYLDLMEFVVPVKRGDPYTEAPGWYVVGEVAGDVWREIEAKDAKYGLQRKTAVHLLIYTTHALFRLAEEVLSFTTYLCKARGTAFASIVCFQPPDEVTCIHPHSGFDFTRFDPKSTYETTVLLADPSSFQRESTGAVVVRLRGPKEKPKGRVVILGPDVIAVSEKKAE